MTPKTSSEERVARRKSLTHDFLKQFSTRGAWRFRASVAQLKAGAKKAADMQMARERKSA